MFNNVCARYASTVSDPTLARNLSGGQAYEFTTQKFLNSIDDATLRGEVVYVFTQAMRTVWYVGLAFALLGLVVTLFEKEVTLRTALETEFGMVEEKKRPEQQDQAYVDIALSTVGAHQAEQAV